MVSLEQTHARLLSKELVPHSIDLLVVDVSFTSLSYVLPYSFPLLTQTARAICLFKPQFEVDRSRVLPGGLVSETDAEKALATMLRWFQENEITVNGQIKSPVKGLHGNQEYLLHLSF